jgi:hypothetical protein
MILQQAFETKKHTSTRNIHMRNWTQTFSSIVLHAMSATVFSVKNFKGATDGFHGKNHRSVACKILFARDRPAFREAIKGVKPDDQIAEQIFSW